MKLEMHVTNAETLVPEGAFIYSQTDLKGVITEANAVFAEISGYTVDEMIGKPHNLVRHPDMPREAFTDMWKSLKAGRPWRGVVKNRRKDGGFYWVIANASPVRDGGRIVGYQSLRQKPTREQIKAAETAYRRIISGDTTLHIEEGRAVCFRTPLYRFLHRPDTQFLCSALSAMLAGLVGVTALALPASIMHSSLRFGAYAIFLMTAFSGFCTTFLLLPKYRRYRTNLRDYIERILSSGNLAASSNLDFGSQTDEIGSRLLLLVSWMRTTVQCIFDAVTPVKHGTEEVLTAVLEIEEATQMQAASSSSVAAAAAELDLTLREVAEHLQTTHQVVSGSGSKANEGVEVSQRATEQIARLVDSITTAAAEVEALSASSAEVAKIASVIREIADQTNLLALNASIEAARAGEAGRGFAVVAHEVRSLADRTRQATEQIESLIVTIRNDSERAIDGMKSGENKVLEGVGLVRGAQDVLTSINTLMGDAVSKVSEIASASSQQSQAIGEISASIASVARTTEQNAGVTSRTTEKIRNLTPLISRVTKAVDQYAV